MSTKDIAAIEEGNAAAYASKDNEETGGLCTSNRVVEITQKVIAEAIGTYFLIFVGCGSVAMNKIYGSITFPGACMAWGFIVMVMIYSVGHISGAHFNPAVTIAFAIFRHFPYKQVPLYVVAQMIGAILASGTLYLLFEVKSEAFFGTVPVGSSVQSLVVEFITSFLWMFVISGVATDNRSDTLFDEFVLAHVLGWWGKAIMIRNQPLLWVLSIGFELMEAIIIHIFIYTTGFIILLFLQRSLLLLRLSLMLCFSTYLLPHVTKLMNVIGLKKDRVLQTILSIVLIKYEKDKSKIACQ